MEKKKSKGYNKGWDNLTPFQFKEGQSGNPKGRPVGKRNFRTIYRDAMEEIGKLTNMEPEDIETIITAIAIKKAVKGDFFFYQDLQNRLHGKPKETMDITSGGKSLAEVLVAMKNNGGDKRGPTKRATTKNQKRS